MHGKKEIISTRKLNFYIRKDRQKKKPLSAFQVSPIPCRGKAEKSPESKLARLQCKAERLARGAGDGLMENTTIHGHVCLQPSLPQKSNDKSIVTTLYGREALFQI